MIFTEIAFRRKQRVTISSGLYEKTQKLHFDIWLLCIFKLNLGLWWFQCTRVSTIKSENWKLNWTSAKQIEYSNGVYLRLYNVSTVIAAAQENSIFKRRKILSINWNSNKRYIARALAFSIKDINNIDKGSFIWELLWGNEFIAILLR